MVYTSNMICPKCYSNFTIVVGKTKIRKRNFFALCTNGHVMKKKDNMNTTYEFWINIAVNYGTMVWMNK